MAGATCQGRWSTSWVTLSGGSAHTPHSSTLMYMALSERLSALVTVMAERIAAI